MTNNRLSRLSDFQKKLGYVFKDIMKLETALTHSSYANERRMNKPEDNERLEFLGDAVLELVMSENLFNKYPEKDEGELSKIRASKVCENALAYCARQIGLGKMIELGNGEKMMGGADKPSILSDALEAVIGAIYLDGGFTSAKEFIKRIVITDVEDKTLFCDSKTTLQQILQGEGDKSLEYKIIGEEGPDHNKKFKVAVIIDGEVCEVGEGHTKKAAEQDAARKEIEKLNVSKKH
ncbi:MAG: ribonuclease III [Lachnospiraceae bacterium]|jgi:ribonuclease-3|nr:ribonuclease III [Lachnospiraceae bacterium]